jgi:hypothetical protein
MSVFEQETSPLLTPLIQDKPHRIASARHLSMLARWAFKTALMFECAHKPPWHVPPEHFRYLNDHRLPPPTASVALGRYLPQPGQTAWAAWGERANVGPPPLESPPPKDWQAYRVTFSIGHAVFQVYGHNGPVGYVLERVGVGGDERFRLFAKIWLLPIEAVTWPSQQAFDTPGLKLLEGGQPEIRGVFAEPF